MIWGLQDGKDVHLHSRLIGLLPCSLSARTPTTPACCSFVLRAPRTLLLLLLLQKVAATALWEAAKLEEVPEVSNHPRELMDKVMVAIDRCTVRRDLPDATKLPVLEQGSKVRGCGCLWVRRRVCRVWRCARLQQEGGTAGGAQARSSGPHTDIVVPMKRFQHS